MQKVDLIVRAPHCFTMAGEGVGYLGGVDVVVDAGKIIAITDRAVTDQEYTAEELIELTHHALFPGLIDGHMHTSWAVLRGLAQDTNNWMMYGLGPFSNVTTEASRLAGSRLAVIEAVRNGTTTIGDYATDMEPVCEFIDQVGARGNITHTIREARRRVYHPGELYEFDEAAGEQSLQDNLQLFDRWHNRKNGRFRVLLGPQGADFLSQELLLRVQRLAKERGTKIHMHTQQGDRETYQVLQRYGQRPIAWLKEIGYLDETLIAVHLTDARDDEAQVVAESGASMIVCPGSIGIIDGIVPPSVAFQAAGGNVALGSDQAPGNNCHNIINEMKLVALFNKIKYQNPEMLPAWRALRMATIEGARALGLGDLVGSLEVGKRADLIAIDLHQPSMMPVYTHPMRNIVPNLVYSARGDEVALSIVDGRVIFQGGKVLGVDEAKCLADVQAFTDTIGEQATPQFRQINGTNQQFMRAGRL